MSVVEILYLAACVAVFLLFVYVLSSLESSNLSDEPWLDWDGEELKEL
jgi:hypothetical protein